MKTTLLITLFAGVLASAQAQDFRAVPPAEQPNAAELAYFGSKHPNAVLEEQQDKGAVALVTGFLTDLADNQLESDWRTSGSPATGGGVCGLRPRLRRQARNQRPAQPVGT